MKYYIFLFLAVVLVVVYAFFFNNNLDKKGSDNLIKNQNESSNQELIELDSYIPNIEEFLLHKVEVAPEDTLKSTDYGYANSYIGEIYKSKISDAFKVVYSLDKVLKSNFMIDDKNYERLDSYICEVLENKTNSACDGIFNLNLKLKVSSLEKIASNVFNGVKLKNNFQAREYNDINSINCKDGMCDISLYIGFKGKVYENYMSKIVEYKDSKDKLVYRVKAFYYVEDMNKEITEIYDTRDNGKKIKEIKLVDFRSLSFEDLENEFNEEDITYTFYFDAKTKKLLD